MRLFVAATLPENMLDALAETSAAVRDAVHGRYVAPDTFHVTLAFLGEVEASRVPDLVLAIERACSKHGPLAAELGELGSFGRSRHAILWQAVNGGEELVSLAEDLKAELRHDGFSFDDKSLRAHVTLMRNAQLDSGVLPMPHMANGMIENVVLYRSDLTGAHPRYDALEIFSL